MDGRRAGARAPATRLACAACGAEPSAAEPFPVRCPNAGTDDADHLLVRTADPAVARFAPDATSVQPFVRHRGLLHSRTRAAAGGMDDAAFVALIEELDRRVAAVDRGFAVTPFAPHRIGGAAGMRAPVWLKDETRAVAGSHKARHLFGLLLHLEVSERLGLTSRAESDRRGLAIASCGNAALAAATLARAAGRPLEVFIPADANPRVVAKLEALGARIAVCGRSEGVPGDPCVHGFHAALARGALPFCVQGNENGLTIEGGMTLGWELAEGFAAHGLSPRRLFVQVGGGALGSSVAQSLAEAHALGAIGAPPALHAVQTHGCYPLRRAYVRLRGDALDRIGVAHALGVEDASMDAPLAERLLAPDGRDAVAAALGLARANRSRYMWPWESAPHSVAHGILDDETYDWFALAEAMFATGGWPVTVDDAALEAARGLAQGEAGIPADATGAAALAGWSELVKQRIVDPDERDVVLVTGVER